MPSTQLTLNPVQESYIQRVMDAKTSDYPNGIIKTFDVWGVRSGKKTMLGEYYRRGVKPAFDSSNDTDINIIISPMGQPVDMKPDTHGTWVTHLRFDAGLCIDDMLVDIRRIVTTYRCTIRSVIFHNMDWINAGSNKSKTDVFLKIAELYQSIVEIVELSRDAERAMVVEKPFTQNPSHIAVIGSCGNWHSQYTKFLVNLLNQTSDSNLELTTLTSVEAFPLLGEIMDTVQSSTKDYATYSRDYLCSPMSPSEIKIHWDYGVDGKLNVKRVHRNPV